MAELEKYGLTVHQAKSDGVYTDTIRVHKHERNCVKEGRICKVSVDGNAPKPFAIRGLPDKEKGWIRLDEVSRERLGLNECEVHRFTFEEAGWIEAIRWAINASDPAARIATLIALWLGGAGVVLGLIGIVLSAWGICITLHPPPDSNCTNFRQPVSLARLMAGR